MQVFYTNKFWYTLVLFIMLSGIAYVFHNNSLKNYPQQSHSLSQSDHYALVLGFINNDLDLFHPETYNLMPNLDKPTEFETSITAVDFPLVEYLSAAIMKAFNLRSPLIYRIINIFSSVLALIFIYLITWRMKIPALAGFLLTLILACSPIYIDYQAAILPSVPAFMFAAGAVYFYLLYLEKNKLPFIIITILFIVTASVIRRPFLAFFAAIFIHHLYITFRKQKKSKSLLFWSVGAGLLIGHQLYQYYLFSKYGSAFSGSLNPPTSFTNFIESSKTIFSTWKFYFYSEGVNYLIIGVAVWFFIRLFYKKLSALQVNFLELLVLFTAASFMLYTVLQGHFILNDFYFIDVFYLPFALILIFFISHIHIEIQWKENLFVLLLAIVFFWSISDAKAIYKSRTLINLQNDIEMERINFDGSEQFLNSIGIDKSARLLCLNAYSHNTPLILMNRKGYTIPENDNSALKNVLHWPFGYIVIQNQYLLSNTFAIYPELIKQFKRINSNGKISVFEKTENDSLNFDNRFGLEKIKTLVADIPDSTNDVPENWNKQMEKDTTFFSSPPYSSFIVNDSLLSINVNAINIDTSHSFVEFRWKSKVYFNDRNKKVDLIIRKKINDSTFHNVSYELTNLVNKNNTWQEIQLLCPITDIQKIKGIKIYIDNINKNKFWLDDIDVAIYQSNFE